MNTRSVLTLFTLTGCFASLQSTAAAQGSLTPPPGPPAPAMKSLQQLWDKMDSQSTQLATIQQEHAAQSGLLSQLHSQNTALAAQNTALQAQNQSLMTMLNTMGEAAGTLPWDGGIIDASAGTSGVQGMQMVSLAVAPDGQPAVAYVKDTGSQHVLRYAKYNGTAWTGTTVDASGYNGYAASLAFSPSGQPAISYTSSAYRIKYAAFNGSTWSISDLSPGANNPMTSLAFSPSGQPAIAFAEYSVGRVAYLAFNGTSWTNTNLMGTSHITSRLCLKFHPNTGIATILSYSNIGQSLDYSTLNGASWVTTSVATLQGSAGLSLNFTPGGLPAIAYWLRGDTSAESGLAYAELQANKWNTVTVSSKDGSGNWASLAISPAGQPYVVSGREDGTNTGYHLQFATRQSQRWINSPLSPESKTWGMAPVVLLPNGQPAVAFKDVNGTLHYRFRRNF